VKQHSSRFLKSIAWLYLAFPLSYLVSCAIFFDVPAWACFKILLSPSYYLLSALAVAAGYGFKEMKRWAWYAFVSANILIGYENALVVNEFGETHYKGIAFSLSVVFLVLVIYRVSREIRVPYFFPRIRWWESDPRYRLSVPVSLKRAERAEPAGADIMDLSVGGCFIKLRSELSQDEKVMLDFTVFQIPLSCEGTVVWRTQSTVTHPKGVGVKFLPMDKNQRRALKMITQRLKRISTFYRRSRYLLNQEEFVKKLQELETMPIRPKKRHARVGAGA
jgi:Tfp pilus assembly protein PilZ